MGARILIVDDSRIFRELLRRAVEGAPGIDEVTTVEGGLEALEEIERAIPDLVTLDVVMPGLDGLATLARLRARWPALPVIMVSGLTGAGADAAIEALSKGASDCIAKPDICADTPREELRETLLPRIEALTGGPRESDADIARGRRAGGGPMHRIAPLPRTVSLVAIGVSTGGPEALATLFAALTTTVSVPILVVQHMPRAFTGRLARRLDTLTPLAVAEARAGEPLAPGQVLIAPGEKHMVLERDASGALVVALNRDPPENSCRPSVDVLFRSLAALDGIETLGVMMTGMGQDGLEGCRALAVAGAQIVAQDEASSVVWSMPGAVVRAGLADEVVPLERLAGAITRRLPARDARATEHEVSRREAFP